MVVMYYWLLIIYVWLPSSKSECIRDQLTCADIEYSGRIWGFDVKGVNIGEYTDERLQFIAAWSGHDFQCTQRATSMTFGTTTDTQLYALLNSGPIPSMNTGCCSSSDPRGVCTASGDADSATQLCQQLGYQTGTVVNVDGDGCPSVHWNGTTWTSLTSDWSRTDGYGTSYTCSNPCNTPTNNPTPAPAPTDNNICTYPECNSNVALDIGFLMDESGSINAAEWQIMVDFVERIISWDINSISYITLIEYGSIPTEENGYQDDFSQFVDFSQSSNKITIINELQNNIYSKTGATYTADAVERTLNIFGEWDINNDPNHERRNLLFLLTDGDPTDTVCDNLLDAVNQFDGEIVLIGIGDGLDVLTWTDKLNCLYDDTQKNTFYVSDFTDRDFSQIEGDLREKTCQNNQISNAGISQNKFVDSPYPHSPFIYIKQLENRVQSLYAIIICLAILCIFLCIISICLCMQCTTKRSIHGINVYDKTPQNDPEES